MTVDFDEYLRFEQEAAERHEHLAVPTLEAYLIVSHVRHELELWTRASGTWPRSLVTEGSLRLSGGTVLEVERLYAELPPAT